MRYSKIWFSAFLFAALSASASFDVGREMETEEFWKADPVMFVKRHREQGFKFTSEDRSQADSRRDGAVVWHGLEVYESRVTFGEKGGIDRVEILLFNRGGTETVESVRTGDGRTMRRLKRVDKTMSRDAFLGAVGQAQAKLTPEGTKEPSAEKTRLKNTDILQFVQTWPKTDLPTIATLTWNYEQGAKKTAAFTPGFIRLVVDGPARAASASRFRTAGAKSGAGGRKPPRKLAANVVKDPRGDVFVDNVPMVDQGTKGYCAAAASERVMRYFGTDVDEHEIAAAAGTTADSGTDVGSMVKSVVALGKKYRFAVKAVAGDAGESTEARIANLTKYVEQYNKTAKKLKKPQIAESVYVRHAGNSVMYDPGAASAAMDPEVTKELKTKGIGRPKYNAFLNEVRKNVGTGLPLLWGVTLGIFPEDDLPQARGGHMRLIVGYNDKKGEILYSDSWGKGHELKRMPADWAWTITDTVLAVRPLW